MSIGTRICGGLATMFVLAASTGLAAAQSQQSIDKNVKSSLSFGKDGRKNQAEVAPEQPPQAQAGEQGDQAVEQKDAYAIDGGTKKSLGGSRRR